jgi:hypothetical protein
MFYLWTSPSLLPVGVQCVRMTRCDLSHPGQRLDQVLTHTGMQCLANEENVLSFYPFHECTILIPNAVSVTDSYYPSFWLPPL